MCSLPLKCFVTGDFQSFCVRCWNNGCWPCDTHPCISWSWQGCGSNDSRSHPDRQPTRGPIWPFKFTSAPQVAPTMALTCVCQALVHYYHHDGWWIALLKSENALSGNLPFGSLKVVIWCLYRVSLRIWAQVGQIGNMHFGGGRGMVESEPIGWAKAPPSPRPLKETLAYIMRNWCLWNGL